MEADNQSQMELPKPNPVPVLPPRVPLRPFLLWCSSSNSLMNLILRYPDYAKNQIDIPESQVLIHFPKNTSYHLLDLDKYHPKTPAIGAPVEIKSSPHFNGFEVTHSCNGLLLLEHIKDDYHRAIVCNPLTGEYIFLPESTHVSKNAICAFFVSPSTHQFKVLRVFHRVAPPIPVPDSDSDRSMELDMSSHCSTELDPFSDSDIHSEESVLSSDYDYDSIFGSDSESTDPDDYSVDSDFDRMGEVLVSDSDSWESVIEPGELIFSPSSIYSPCYLNNSAYWLYANYSVPNPIVFFNFETNEFDEFLTPTPITKEHMFAKDDMSLFVLNNSLAIFDGFTQQGEFHVWVMKDYGVWESWSKDFVIDTTAWGMYGDFSYKPVMCRLNGEVMMICEDGYMVLYDVVKKSGRFMKHQVIEFPFEVMAYTASVMLLRDFVVGGNLVVINLASRFIEPDHNILELWETFSE
ncbi:hypothetical protein LXL04_005880 [Taraxacum kok-saghyz]